MFVYLMACNISSGGAPFCFRAQGPRELIAPVHSASPFIHNRVSLCLCTGMNNLVAHTLSALTASVRFPGALNTDLGDLTSNLVPFPKMHFLLPALAPLYSADAARYVPG